MAITEVDERFTSKLAFNTMIASGANKKKRAEKGIIDKLSATIILQSYLEQISLWFTLQLPTAILFSKK